MVIKKILTEEKVKALEEAYKDPNIGLGGAQSLYKKIKDKVDGLTFNNVKDWMKQQEVNQIMEPRNRTYNSFVASGPLEQFQIDLIYMPKSWHNNNFKYVLACVDVFSKKAEMVAMKNKDKTTSTKAFELILERMGVPKTVYSDQGKEFDNTEFNELLKQNNIEIIFASDHAPFVESFNRTMKNRLYKYMALHRTDNWVKAMDKVLDGYNSTPHTSTGVPPNEVSEKNAMDILLKLGERAKKKNYEPIKEGDTVRVPVKNAIKKGYKQQWSYELHIVDEKKGGGVYLVDGELYPRKELQLVRKVVKQPALSEKEMRKKEKEDEIGIALTKPEIKRLTGNLSKREAKQLFEPRQTRQTAKKPDRKSWMTINESNIISGKRRRK
jgi:transposase InsO family protein